MQHTPLTKQRSEWRDITDLDEVSRLLSEAGATDIRQVWRNVHDGQLRVIVAREPQGWHLSISHAKRGPKGQVMPGRYPSWDEIAHARYELLPDDLDFVMHLPPPGEYVALHDTTFHLHQHPEVNNIHYLDQIALAADWRPALAAPPEETT